MNSLSWNEHFITQGRARLQYFTHSPTGQNRSEEWVLFLHGFGQHHTELDALATRFAENQRLISPHLFFHGLSSLEGNSPLRPEEWKALLEALFQEYAIRKIHIVAYSMGCKFALLTTQLLPQYIARLTLLAPDGLVMNPWYRFATRSAGGRLLLAISTRWFPVFRVLVIWLVKVGLVRPSIGRFAEGEMGTAEKRRNVLNIWTRFRYIWPNWKKLSPVLDRHQIPVCIVLGRFDGIISPKRFEPKKAAWKNFEWKMVAAGHSNLVGEAAKRPELFLPT